MSTAAVATSGLEVRFGRVTAVDEADPTVPAGARVRAALPRQLGHDHARADAAAAGPPHLGIGRTPGPAAHMNTVAVATSGFTERFGPAVARVDLTVPAGARVRAGRPNGSDEAGFVRMPLGPARLNPPGRSSRQSVGMSTAAVVTTGLTRRFGRVTAVDGVGFTVPADSRLGLLDLSRSDKTTPVRMLRPVDPTPESAEPLSRRPA